MSKYKANSLFESIKFAVTGLLWAIKSQRNIRIEIFLGMVAIIVGVFLNFSMLEFAVLLITVSFVLMAELLNTIVEFIVDAYFGNKYSTLAKMSKDIAAGLVLMCAALSSVVGFLLFAPKILRLYF
jgi:diacylglycerol kinase (ATP)